MHVHRQSRELSGIGTEVMRYTQCFHSPWLTLMEPPSNLLIILKALGYHFPFYLDNSSIITLQF